MAYWACAQVEANRVGLAVHFLELNNYPVYCPRAQAQRQSRPQLLFPGYVFCAIQLQWHRAARSPGVLRIIMDGDQPAKVADSVIEQLRQREHKGLIELPSPPRLQRGDHVRIVTGPFSDRLAVYHSMRPHERVAVLLRMLGGERRLVLPRRDILRT